jgi:hypothetical protein
MSWLKSFGTTPSDATSRELSSPCCGWLARSMSWRPGV